MRNLGLKLVALVLALAVWIVVSAPRRERAVERRFSASLSLIGMPRAFVITGQVPDQFSVRLRGRKPDLDALSSRNLEVTVDMGWLASAGEATITVQPRALNVPPEVEVMSIDPTKFSFRVERLRQRSVLIRPFLIGELPSGYVAGAASASPDRALVAGPEPQVVAMTEVGTERIIMTGRTDTFVQNVAVVSDSPLVRVIAPVTTQVTVPVLPEIGPNPAVEPQKDTTQ